MNYEEEKIIEQKWLNNEDIKENITLDVKMALDEALTRLCELGKIKPGTVTKIAPHGDGNYTYIIVNKK